MALLTRFVNHAIVGGADDGTSEANAWTYLYQATGAIKTDAGTNQFKVWVKASETYGTDEDGDPKNIEGDDAGHDGLAGVGGSVIFLDQAGTNILPNVFEGYTTTVGDGGIVKIDCQGVTDQLTNGIQVNVGTGGAFAAFKNFQCTNASGSGFETNTGGSDNVTFKKCLAYSNDGAGFSCDNNINFVSCQAESNTGIGFDFDTTSTCVACVSHSNTNRGFSCVGACFYNCLAYNNSSHDFTVNEVTPTQVLGCSCDGENAAGDYGIFQDRASHMLVAVNNILFDADYGIFSDSDSGELAIGRHNLFDTNATNDVNNFLTPSLGAATPGVDGNGDIIDPGDPYTNSATRDYTINAFAKAKGLDATWTESFWDDYNLGAGDNPPDTTTLTNDIGALQSAASGGGILIHTGTNGGFRG